MKLSVNLPLLKEQLEIVKRGVVEHNTTLAHLKTVLFTSEIETGTVTLRTTNLDLDISTHFYARVEDDGKAAIPFATLFDFVSKLGDGDITLELKSNLDVVASANGFTAKIKSLDANDFPESTKVEPKTFLEIETKKLVRALRRILVSASKDESRPTLNCICFQFKNKKFQLLSSDENRASSYYLGEYDVPDSQSLVKLVNVSKILQLAGIQESETTKMWFTDTKAGFEWGNLSVNTQLVIGNYPDFSSVFPDLKSLPNEIIISQPTLKRAVSLAGVFAKGMFEQTRFDVKSDGLYVSARGDGIGDGAGLVESELVGNPSSLILGHQYLLDIVDAVSEPVHIHMIDGMHPVRISEENNDDFVHVVATMSLK